MERRAVVSGRLPTPGGPYSHVIEVGGLAYTAGFGPQDPDTGAVPEGIEAQTDQVLRNVAVALQAVGYELSDVIKVTAHLARLDEDFAGYNRAYARFFNEPFPVRTTVGSALPGILVEIDVVAGKQA